MPEGSFGVAAPDGDGALSSRAGVLRMSAGSTGVGGAPPVSTRSVAVPTCVGGGSIATFGSSKLGALVGGALGADSPGASARASSGLACCAQAVAQGAERERAKSQEPSHGGQGVRAGRCWREGGRRVFAHGEGSELIVFLKPLGRAGIARRA